MTNNHLSRLAASRLGVWTIKCLVSPLQRRIYLKSEGRIFSRIGAGRNVLLLTTKGRRTGKDRATPLFYLREGDSIIVCNVSPAFERINPWVVNLRANPIARIQIGAESGMYRARETTEVETERFWPRLVALWRAYQFHFERGGRRTIFILERV